MLKSERPFGQTDAIRDNSARVAAVDSALLVEYLGMTEEDDLTLVNSMLETATMLLESHVGFSIISQEITYYLQHFAQNNSTQLTPRELPDRIMLPITPAQSLTGIFVTDAEGNETELVVSDYFDVYLVGQRPQLILKPAVDWPETRQTIAGVRIVYRAGFGDTAAAVPADVRAALLDATMFLYENRGAACDTKTMMSKTNVSNLVRRYGRPRL